MKPTNVPIPDRLKARPMWKGFPIPYIVLTDANGAHFKINDSRKVDECAAKKLCHICGQRVERYEYWFISGPKSAFHPQGAYIDGAMHKDCAVYALQVCPYLAYSGYAGFSPENLERSIRKVDQVQQMTFLNHTQSDLRVPFFVLAKAHRYSRTMPTGYFVPHKPWVAIEYWLDGQQISQAEARALDQDHLVP